MDEKMLYDLLKEVRDDQKKHGEILGKHGEELAKQSVCMKNVQKDVGEMKKTVAKNTEDVEKHIYRTDMLEELHKDNQTRISQNEERIIKLEEPVKAKQWFKENLKWVLTVAALSATLITKIMGLW